VNLLIGPIVTNPAVARNGGSPVEKKLRLKTACWGQWALRLGAAGCQTGYGLGLRAIKTG